MDWNGTCWCELPEQLRLSSSLTWLSYLTSMGEWGLCPFFRANLDFLPSFPTRGSVSVFQLSVHPQRRYNKRNEFDLTQQKLTLQVNTGSLSNASTGQWHVWRELYAAASMGLIAPDFLANWFYLPLRIFL